MVKLGLDSWVEMAKRLKDATTRSNINKIIFQTLNTVVVFCFCYGHFLIANSFLKTWPLKIIVQKGQSKIVGNWQKNNKKWSSFLKIIWFFWILFSITSYVTNFKHPMQTLLATNLVYLDVLHFSQEILWEKNCVLWNFEYDLFSWRNLSNF